MSKENRRLYSVAIWLLENWPLVDAYNIEIVGSDIDSQALDEARVGRYEQRALSRMPPDVPWWRVVRSDGTWPKGAEQRARLLGEDVPTFWAM